MERTSTVGSRGRTSSLVEVCIDEDAVTVTDLAGTGARPSIIVSASVAASVCEADVTEVLAELVDHGSYTCERPHEVCDCDGDGRPTT